MRMVSQHQVAATPKDEKEPPALEKETRFCYVPQHKLVITYGSGACHPRLWKISNDGENSKEVWFPSYLYMGGTSSVAVAPTFGTRDRRGMIWLRTQNGRSVGFSSYGLVKRKVVSSLEVDLFVIPAFLRWRVSVVMFIWKIILFAINGLQLLYLGNFSTEAAHQREQANGLIRRIKDAIFGEIEHHSELMVALAMTVWIVLLFVLQEHLKEWRLMNPMRLTAGITNITVELYMLVIALVGLLPLSAWLLGLSAQCSTNREAPEAAAIAAVQVQDRPTCWGVEHVFLFILPPALCCLALFYIGARLTRVYAQLNRVNFTLASLFDWSADAYTEVDSGRIPRKHPFETKDPFYDFKVVSAKFLVLVHGYFSRFIMNLDADEGDWSQINTFAIICLSMGWVLKTSFSNDRFFDTYIDGGLSLPFGLEPNGVQAAMDSAVFFVNLKWLMWASCRVTPIGQDLVGKYLKWSKDWSQVCNGIQIIGTMLLGYCLRLCCGSSRRARRKGERLIAMGQQDTPSATVELTRTHPSSKSQALLDAVSL